MSDAVVQDGPDAAGAVGDGVGFSASAVEAALGRMRWCAQRAHADAGALSGPAAVQAGVRMRLFCEAAADLAGSSLEVELARAAGEPGEPAWSLPYGPAVAVVP